MLDGARGRIYSSEEVAALFQFHRLSSITYRLQRTPLSQLGQAILFTLRA
uniref:DUF2575 domain-containing protein n=1 Tax=Mesocestoides corti TaxID=53468 RepID=A0A5K3FN02_MESCO